jgi:ABC-2 type transport system permease protein
MIQMMKKTWRIALRDKEFVMGFTITPLVVFLVMSFLLAYSTDHKIAVIGAESAAIAENIGAIEGFELVDVARDDAAAEIASGAIELAVIVDGGQATLLSNGKSEALQTVTLIVNHTLAGGDSGAEFTQNEVPPKGRTIAYSLGFMILKLVGDSALLAALLIKERNGKIRDRILLAGVSEASYLGGIGLSYLLCTMIGSVVYFAAPLLLGFDLGMRTPLGYLLMLFSANVLSVALFIFVASILKSDGSILYVQAFLLTPLAMFSGALFPFHLAPQAVRTIANVLPYRWIIGGVEAMQKSGGIAAALPNIAMIIALAAVLFAAATVIMRRKSVG